MASEGGEMKDGGEGGRSNEVGLDMRTEKIEV